MRILHVIPQFPYFGGRTIVGGHASSLLTLALVQHANGEEVSILTYTQGRSGTYTIDDGPMVTSLFEGAKTRTVKFAMQFCVKGIKWLRRHRNAFDVIHFHSGYMDYLAVSALMRAASGLPTIHTLYCPVGKSRTPLPFGDVLWAKMANRLDGVVGISDNVVASMRLAGIRAAGRIRPGLEAERFWSNEDREAVRLQLGIPGDEIAILFVGNASPQKNLTGVLYAIHELRRRAWPVRLIITTELAHTSPDEVLARIARLIEDLHLEECVIQKRIVPDMPALMRASDIVVAPFLDSFGPSDYFIAALEAMAAERPVVVSKVGGMVEIVTPEVGALVDPGDPRSIADALEKFCSDPQLRVAAGRRGRALIEKEFSPLRTAEEYRRKYEEVAA